MRYARGMRLVQPAAVAAVRSTLTDQSCTAPAPPWIMHAERRVLPARSADGRDAGRKWRCRCCRTAANILFVWPSETQPGPPAIVIAEVTETPSTVKKVDSEGPARP